MYRSAPVLLAIFSTQVEMNRIFCCCCCGSKNFLYAGGDEPRQNRAAWSSEHFLYAGGDEPFGCFVQRKGQIFSLRRWR